MGRGWDVHLGDEPRRAVHAAASAAIVYVVVRAAPAPAAHPLVFELLIASATLIAIVHVIGALEGKQPWIETAEIPFWAAVAIVAALVYRSL